MDKKNSSSDTEFIIAIFILLGLAGYVWWEKYKHKIIIDIMNIGFIVLGILFLIFTIVLLFYIYKKVKENLKIKRERKKYLEKEKNKLIEILNNDFSSNNSSEIKQKLENIREFIDFLPHTITSESQNKINNFFTKINNIILKKELQEKKERSEEEIRIIKKEELKQKQEEKRKIYRKKQVSELFEFKKEKNSINALPLNKKYSKNIIKEAEWRIKKHLEEKENQKIKIEEAKDYYKDHDLNSKPHLENEEEEEIYRKIRNDIKEGKLELKKKPNIEYTGKKLEKDFYRTKDLDEETKLKAKAQGFKYTRGVELSGSICGGGFYIKKENPRESSYHFYMKHLFSELHPNTRIEYQIEDKRVDVALFIEDFKIGIEIETGANRIEHLAAKILWLNKHFDQWIFVCPRKLIPRYNKLVDHEKSFCLSPKKAKEHILELITPVEQL
ncbi:hypothetical protein K8R47_01865 [archaeon]|nr:hypothetical protein [archaeon]